MARMLGRLAVSVVPCVCLDCGAPSRSLAKMRGLRRRVRARENRAWRREVVGVTERR